MSELLDALTANSESICRALADSTADFICLATSHGEPFYLNPAGRRMAGLAEDESAPPGSLRDYYAEDSWKELRDVAVPAVNRSGHWEGRSQLRNRKTGDPASRRDHHVSRQDAAKRQTDLPGHRASRRRAADRLREALAESQARKNSILESSLDPIITINHEGMIIEFNRAAEQTFGHSRDKVLGTRPSDVLFPPSISAGHRNRIERYLEAGEGSMLGKRVEVTAVAGQRRGLPRRNGHDHRPGAAARRC